MLCGIVLFDPATDIIAAQRSYPNEVKSIRKLQLGFWNVPSEECIGVIYNF